MRRFVCAILSLLLLFSLVACNSDLPQGSETSESDTLESQETDKPTEKPTRPARPTEPPLDSNGEEEDIKVNTQYTALNYEDMKCMWLSQFDLSSIYCENGKQRDAESFRALMATVLDNVKANGMNTVILQLRPNADSMYPSEVYPPSAYVVGAYGNKFSYDAIEIVLELAKERELSIHAWINPLRAMTDSQIRSVPRSYAIRKWLEDDDLCGKYIVKVGENWYLNPAYAEVRELILDGAREIMENYNFDGLHIDDYFYPTTDESFDNRAYYQYIREDGKLALADWRRENLNKLISEMYSLVKSAENGALYGISPAGNWNNVYNSHCADMYTWCAEEGYIDYICPQVYFGMEHGSFDFVKTCNEWQSYIKNDKVKLVIGMSLGKAQSGTDNYAGDGKYEWRDNKDVLKRCLEYTKELERCVGVAYFCYQYFYHPISAEPNASTQEERDNFIPLLKEISWKK
ncbi:MAG: family 10 glycosylhydrolase [Clostridia bacterium]|nr:family 10 glycosylhydrolase [Clostridia bacterium]